MSSSRQSNSPGARKHAGALTLLAEAVRLLGLDSDLYRTLATPHRSVALSIPIQRDDGAVENVRGFRVHHNLARGPVNGGVHVHPDADLPAMMMRAMWATWKHALVGIPFGGAAGGLSVALPDLPPHQRKHVARRYVDEVLPLIGGAADAPAGIGASDRRLAAWILDDHAAWERAPEPDAAGPAGPGTAHVANHVPRGSAQRVESVARGIVVTTLDALRAKGVSPDRATVAVRGLGALGTATLRHLAREGCTVAAVCDLAGGCHRAAGLDVAHLLREHAAGTPLREYEQADPITDAELLGLDVDALVLIADDALCAGQAARINARLVVEGVGMPFDPDTDACLNDRGITVIPDILACAGGATHSYFAWVRSLRPYSWSQEDVDLRLREMLTDAHRTVRAVATERRLTLRHAAHLVGVDRVAHAQRRR